MGRMFFTADWHFGDERMELLGRPWLNAKEAQDQILKNIFDLKLTKDDVLYVIGDAALDEEWLKPVQLIDAQKVLIKGNYDRLDNETYLKYFQTVSDGFQMCAVRDPSGKAEPLDLNFVHYPGKGIHSAFNLVGHIHGAWKVQKNMLNVGIDQHWARPIPLEKVFFYHTAVSKFYDQDVWVGDHPANVAHASRGQAGTYWERQYGGSNEAVK